MKKNKKMIQEQYGARQEPTKSSILTRDLLEFAELLAPPLHEPLTCASVIVAERDLALTAPFETSFGRFDHMTKLFPQIAFHTRDKEVVEGLGEGTPLPYPWYDGESDATVRTVLKNYILPALSKHENPITSVHDFIARYRNIVGHNMAKAAVEGAYWDAVGKLLDKPVYALWGGTKTEVEAGTSVGLEKTPGEVLCKIDRAVEMGVKRVKIKIAPGRDIQFVAEIRKKYPELPLQVDGNAAYNLFNPQHITMLQELDNFGLLMIEQPGPNDDRYYHHAISKLIKTPICLDESILHTRHAIEAIQMWANDGLLERLIINIKPPRVGGFWEAIKIAKVCERSGVPTWCGGMLESVLGKTANAHFSTISAVNMPGDHVSQGPYYKNDVAEPLTYANGRVTVPTEPGWGIDCPVVYD